jgi:hypothetical protein
VPVRDPNVIAVIFGVLVLILLRVGVKSSGGVSLETFEGKAVRASLFVPAVMLMGRTLYLYDPSNLLVGAFLLSAAYCAFRAAKSIEKRGILEASSALTAGFGWYFVSLFVHGLAVFPPSLALPLLALPYSVVLTLMSRSAQRGEIYRTVAAALALSVVVFNVVDFQDAGATIACLIVGIVLMSYGVLTRKWVELVGGALCGAAGLSVHVYRAVRVEHFLNWGTLSVLGLAAVFAAAYFERNGDRVIASLRKWALREGQDALSTQALSSASDADRPTA